VAAPATAEVGTGVPASALTATLAASSGLNATGMITFTVFGPASSAPPSCTAGGASLGSAAVAGDGTYQAGEGFTPDAPGTYWLYASYSGDGSDSPAASACPPSVAIVVR
jgi:hypothetical protein